MVTTQTQIRRDTAANLAAATPVAGELGYDTTNKRIVAGDGATAGGIPHANAPDVQKQSFILGTVGGTADAITLTNSPAVGSLVNGLRLKFKATGTNTAAATVNVDGLGVKNIYKLSGTTLVATTANDIVSGVFYELTYDGTQFQLGSGIGGSAGSDYQPFTSSGTWNKPTGYSSSARVLLEAWAAGGGGGSGAGDGGDTTIGTLLRARGGSRGSATVGGSGGGYGATSGTRTNDTGFEGYGSDAAGANGTGGFYTGGGGGRNGTGLPSVWGGGGGGSGAAGGVSQFGGAGGTTSAGVAPGGGGASNSGADAAGGGGSYRYRWVMLSDLGATETITIGAGGTAGASAFAGAKGEARITVFG